MSQCSGINGNSEPSGFPSWSQIYVPLRGCCLGVPHKASLCLARLINPKLRIFEWTSVLDPGTAVCEAPNYRTSTSSPVEKQLWSLSRNSRNCREPSQHTAIESHLHSLSVFGICMAVWKVSKSTALHVWECLAATLDLSQWDSMHVWGSQRNS